MSDTWWVNEGQLMDEQLEVLGEEVEQDVLLSGPPGSGKTNILLLRANHLFIASPDTEFYIVCFTKLLQNFIRLGAHQYHYPANRIVTQQKLFEQVLADYGTLPSRIPGQTYDERNKVLKQAMCQLMSTNAGKGAYPVLFIDEAQDYSELDLSIFRYLARHLNCAADLRQSIYGEGATGEAWLANHNWGSSIALKYHHRVAPAVLEVADKVMNGKFGHEPMLETHQYKGDTGDVEVQAGIGFNEQIEAAATRIAKQLNVYPGQLVGVMVPLRDNVGAIVDALSEETELAGLVTNCLASDFDSTKPVWVSTVHSAKGLEFRCCHILTADDFARFTKYERRAVFTAITRAKTALSIYHREDLHPFFAAALAKKSGKKIAIHNLFGKSDP